MPKCPCEKLTSGERAYECDMLGCPMVPHYCQKFLDDPRWRALYMHGMGPTQKTRDAMVAKAEKPKRQLPPLRTQVVNFIKVFAAWAGDCFRCVGEEEFDRRVGICSECEFFIRKSGRCSQCGCCGKLKAMGKVWRCPKGKW